MAQTAEPTRFIATLKKKEGLSSEEFRRLWLDHGKRFKEIPIVKKNVKKYEQVCLQQFEIYVSDRDLETSRLRFTSGLHLTWISCKFLHACLA